MCDTGRLHIKLPARRRTHARTHGSDLPVIANYLPRNIPPRRRTRARARARSPLEWGPSALSQKAHLCSTCDIPCTHACDDDCTSTRVSAPHVSDRELRDSALEPACAGVAPAMCCWARRQAGRQSVQFCVLLSHNWINENP